MSFIYTWGYLTLPVFDLLETELKSRLLARQTKFERKAVGR